MAVKKNVFYNIPLHEPFLFRKSRFPDTVGVEKPMFGKNQHQFLIGIKYTYLLPQLFR